MVVGVLEVAGVDLHLPGEHRSQLGIDVVPGRDAGAALGQVAVGRDDAELLLPGERLLAQLVPALVELALVLVGPLLRHVVRRVGRPRREVGEERLVGHQRLLLADPLGRLRREVVVEVVALLRRLVRLDRRGALVERRVALVRLAAEEAVEVLEAHAGRPLPVRPHRARLPHRHLVALAELRGAVAVELQDLGQRGGGVRPDRVVARRRRRQLGDVAHPDRVVVAAGQQRRAGRRAQRRRVEAGVLQPVGGESLEVRRAARADHLRRAGGMSGIGKTSRPATASYPM